MLHSHRLLGVALLSATLTAAAAEPGLTVAGSFVLEGVKGCEIITVHAPTRTAVVTCSDAGSLLVLDLSTPAAPKQATMIDLGLADGEELTTATVHPDGKRVLVAIKAGADKRGRVELWSLATRSRLAAAEAGYGCDSVVVAPDGRTALVCNEAEDFAVVDGRAITPPGSVTLLRLDGGETALSAVTIALTDATGTPGFTAATDGRFIERSFAKGPVEFRGTQATVDEEGLALLPLLDHQPDVLEPEGAVFTPDGTTAWVTLQENNGLLRIDVATATATGYFGLGTTTHAADVAGDDTIAFTTTLTALREPDGIAITPCGRYLITADEGDTDPKASKIKAGKPAGGGRTVTVIDAATGAVLGDTGSGIDEAAAAAGCYPDKRSTNKGCEPEMVATFDLGGVTYAAVTLERAEAVALVSLADPAKPTVVAVTPLGKGHKAPEGIAVATFDGVIHVLTANEKSGTVSILTVQP